MPSSSFRPRSAAWTRAQRANSSAAWAAPAAVTRVARSVSPLSASSPLEPTLTAVLLHEAPRAAATGSTEHLPPVPGELAWAYVSPGVRCSAQLRSHCDAPMLFLAGRRGVRLGRSQAYPCSHAARHAGPVQHETIKMRHGSARAAASAAAAAARRRYCTRARAQRGAGAPVHAHASAARDRPRRCARPPLRILPAAQLNTESLV